MWCHQWPSRHHHQHPLVLVPPPFFLSLEPTPLSFPLPLLPLLLVVVVRWMERQVRASPTTHHHCALWLVPRFSAVCVVCCVVAWWAWLVVVLVATPRLFRCHQCLCFQSFTTHPPRFTTQSQSLSSSCPCAHSFCHSLTQPSHTTTPHTHAWWLVHFGAWCVCAHGVGCGRAWLATHTSTHSLCPTPHHSSSCCCWWWMWWWQRGCCGVCGHLVHSLAVLVLSTPDSHTHTG